MVCLLAAATAAEISPFLSYYKNTSNELAAGLQVDVLITGVGLVASMYSILKQIHTRKPAIIIQAGIAGCFDKAIPLGSVLAIKQEAVGDQFVLEQGKMKSLFDLGFISKDQFPFSKGWLVNNSEVLKKLKLKKVTGITVNEITTSPQKISLYQNNFNPVTESLEGAALHYICLMEKTPFLQIRAISNYIGERNKKKWDLANSIDNLNKELIRLLKKLPGN